MSLNFGCCAPSFGNRTTAAASMNANPMGSATKMQGAAAPNAAPVPALKFQAITSDFAAHMNGANTHSFAPKFGFLAGIIPQNNAQFGGSKPNGAGVRLDTKA